jgi:putative restriction endonuclease
VLPTVQNVTVRGYVGVTDFEWYEFLSDRRELTEVNFWRPRDQKRFKAIHPGELFFFKLRARNGSRVVGGGIFADWELLPLSAAWDVYEEGNGAATLPELRRLIGGHAELGPRDDPEIGCILLRDVRFFDPTDTAGPPPEWGSGIMQGKAYDIDDPRYAGYFDILAARVLGSPVDLDLTSPEWHRAGPMFSDPRLRRERLGQGGFRAAVFNAYNRRCAITGAKVWPVLEAAHIVPVTRSGEHRIDNGLLLRSDVHTMFDRGFLGVDPRYRLRVSPLLRAVYGNGDKYYAQEGQVIALPERKGQRPNPDFLQWHLDEIFQAS